MVHSLPLRAELWSPRLLHAAVLPLWLRWVPRVKVPVVHIHHLRGSHGLLLVLVLVVGWVQICLLTAFSSVPDSAVLLLLQCGVS